MNKPKKVKKVKAWAIVSNGKIGVSGISYQPEITFHSKEMAYEIIRRGIYVIGEGYEPKVVPCEITYKI